MQDEICLEICSNFYSPVYGRMTMNQIAITQNKGLTQYWKLALFIFLNANMQMT